MQLLAHDEWGQPVAVTQAYRQKDYFCMECRGTLRVRGGDFTCMHYFHVEAPKTCKLHNKSLTHLEVQKQLRRLLPRGETQMEHRFPTLSRIADLVWLPQKIVFEIQCSFIAASEVESRNHDYKREGYTVVWILHDERFNTFRHSGAEFALISAPHYFTNITCKKGGIFYDQFDVCQDGIRKEKLSPLQIDPRKLKKMERLSSSSCPSYIEQRVASWPIFFEGDLVDLWKKEANSLFRSAYFEEVLKLEAKYPKPAPERKLLTGLKRFWNRTLRNLYHEILQIFLGLHSG